MKSVFANIWLGCALAEMIAIWIVSSMSRPVGDYPLPFPHADKAVHFVEFFLLTFFWIKALTQRRIASPFFISIVISLAWSLIDEWHQMYVPGRNADIFDVLFDCLGILSCFFVMKRLVRHRSFN